MQSLKSQEDLAINMKWITKQEESVLIVFYTLQCSTQLITVSVENTLGLDGDPIDVLVFLTEPTVPGCVIEVKQSVLLKCLMTKDKMKN